ncbi:Phosphoribosylamine--glycine ligase [Geodia barretti]|uniref:phosphoribosylamine--glycine ligase n=1 Tax=Geodia barretti TaxID=519541 RepID=A0AA35RTS8_GEOBA|nr:Phosphoribosylamine--glycine ligase [Geodia barretti]
MRALVVGAGARENALVWALSRSPTVSHLYAGPGNAGTAQITHNLPDLDPLDPQAVLAECRKHAIDLALIGPEAPLAAGAVDVLDAAGIAAFGATRAAARLESSNGAWCVKRDGLADGKGVLDSADPDALVAFARDGLEAGPILLEEHMSGPELSAFVLLNGGAREDYLLLPYCADYKKQHEGEMGLNTGGMGSFTPVPWITDDLDRRIRTWIIDPTVEGMAEQGLSYRGVLYIGLMVTDDGPKVIEYNVRFGDPEAQALIPTLDTDLATLFEAVAAGRLPAAPRQRGAAVVVVVASGGYPARYETGFSVDLPAVDPERGLIFHAGTRTRDGRVVTGGGRCFSSVGLGPDLAVAADHAYELAERIRFHRGWYRRDIAAPYRSSR